MEMLVSTMKKVRMSMISPTKVGRLGLRASAGGVIAASGGLVQRGIGPPPLPRPSVPDPSAPGGGASGNSIAVSPAAGSIGAGSALEAAAA